MAPFSPPFRVNGGSAGILDLTSLTRRAKPGAQFFYSLARRCHKERPVHRLASGCSCSRSRWFSSATLTASLIWRRAPLTFWSKYGTGRRSTWPHSGSITRPKGGDGRSLHWPGTVQGWLRRKPGNTHTRTCRVRRGRRAIPVCRSLSMGAGTRVRNQNRPAGTNGMAGCSNQRASPSMGNAVARDSTWISSWLSIASALVEYKHERALPQYPSHPSYRALSDLGSQAGIPVFGVRYADDSSWFKVSPLNRKAKDFVQRQKLMTEREWVSMLYRTKGRKMPEDLLDNRDFQL